MPILYPVLRQVTMISSKLSNIMNGDDWVEENPDQAFHWNGQVATGQTLEVIGTNGTMRARGVEGSEVRVLAVKRGDSVKMQKVSVQVEQTAEGVRIRAVYPKQLLLNRNNVEVNFVVEVPVGVRMVARVANGGINVKSLSGSTELFTGNGGISISDSGWVSAEAVNGFIRASIREPNWTKPLHFRTANGSINVELPQNASTRIRAKTNNGTVAANFPLSQIEKKSHNYLSGVLGANDQRELICECGNGSVHLSQAT